MREPTAADWTLRYLSGATPWDLCGPHPELVARLADLGAPGGAVVPGAGRGHDARVLADAGWRVTALEIVGGLERELHDAVGWAGDVTIGDAFEWIPGEPVDLVFDHTFFCAIPLRRRSEFGVWARSVVRPGGRVVSIVFPIGRDRAAGGPPFGMTTDDLADVLAEDFELRVDTPAAHPVRRSWPTRWAEFVRC